MLVATFFTERINEILYLTDAFHLCHLQVNQILKDLLQAYTRSVAPVIWLWLDNAISSDDMRPNTNNKGNFRAYHPDEVLIGHFG